MVSVYLMRAEQSQARRPRPCRLGSLPRAVPAIGQGEGHHSEKSVGMLSTIQGCVRSGSIYRKEGK